MTVFQLFGMKCKDSRLSLSIFSRIEFFICVYMGRGGIKLNYLEEN